MNNNELFMKILHLTGADRDKGLLIKIFSMGGIEASSSKIKGWRTSIDNPRSSHMPDDVLEAFFHGLFEYRDMQLDHGINVFNFSS